MRFYKLIPIKQNHLGYQLLYIEIQQQAMTFKMRETSSNLFTLNQSLKLGDHLKSDQSSIMDEPSDINFGNNDLDNHRQQIQKLSEEIEVIKKQNYHLKLKNKQIKDSLEIAELHNKKHQQKQRELIKKLSHEQINNKQLEFEIKKANEEVLRIKQNAKNSDSKNIQASYSLKKAQQQRTIFIQSFRKITQAISKCQKVDEFQSCVSKFLQFLKKNIKYYESADLNGQFQFDLKFQLGQISSLKSRTAQLEGKNTKLKDQLQKEKVQKRKLGASFNQKLLKLKDQCDGLRSRLSQISNQMNERQNELQMEINSLRKSLGQKNEIICELKYKMDSEKKGKESVCSKKSRVRKRSYYISDGQREIGRPFSDIENQIEYLERQISQVMQEIKQ